MFTFYRPCTIFLGTLDSSQLKCTCIIYYYVTGTKISAGFLNVDINTIMNTKYFERMPIDDHHLKNAKISDVTEHGPHGADRLLVGPDHEGDVAELRQVSQEPHVVTQPSLVQISQIGVISLINTSSRKMQVSSNSSSSS